MNKIKKVIAIVGIFTALGVSGASALSYPVVNAYQNQDGTWSLKTNTDFKSIDAKVGDKISVGGVVYTIKTKAVTGYDMMWATDIISFEVPGLSNNFNGFFQGSIEVLDSSTDVAPFFNSTIDGVKGFLGNLLPLIVGLLVLGISIRLAFKAVTKYGKRLG